MCHSIGHMLRSVTSNKLSVKEFHERLQNKDGEINSNMFSLLSHMRGSKEYFAKLGMDVKWMMKTLGPPTLFVTCSCAEWFSESLISYLRSINSTVPGIETMTPSELCAMDPVNVSIHFHNKWDAIFNKLICSKDQPIFGKVDNYVYRIEYLGIQGELHMCMQFYGYKILPLLDRTQCVKLRNTLKRLLLVPSQTKTAHQHYTNWLRNFRLINAINTARKHTRKVPNFTRNAALASHDL